MAGLLSLMGLMGGQQQPTTPAPPPVVDLGDIKAFSFNNPYEVLGPHNSAPTSTADILKLLRG
jgi:hypothetical protein